MESCFIENRSELPRKLSSFNPLSAKLTKWPNTLKQFVGNLATNCLNVFGHFMGLAFKGLRITKTLKHQSIMDVNKFPREFFE